MRFVTDRKELGKVLNFGKYPVIMFDLDTPKKGWDDVYEGSLVRVDCGKFSDGENWLEVSTPTIFVDNDNKGVENTLMNRLTANISVMAGCACISDSFGVSDVIKDAKGAMAPIIKADDEVAVVYTWDGGENCAVRIMKCGKVARHTYPIMRITD